MSSRMVDRVRMCRSKESIAGSKLLLLESMKKNKEKLWQGNSVTTLFLHLSLLPSGGDQIVTDDEEKINSLSMSKAKVRSLTRNQV